MISVFIFYFVKICHFIFPKIYGKTLLDMLHNRPTHGTLPLCNFVNNIYNFTVFLKIFLQLFLLYPTNSFSVMDLDLFQF